MKAVDALAGESDRLEELRLRGKSQYLQALCARMKLPGSSLRTLILEAPDGEFNNGRTVPECRTLIAHPGSFPKLRHVEIKNLPVRWQDGIFSNAAVNSLTVTAFFHREGRMRREPPKTGKFEQLLLTLEQLAPSLSPSR
ncbi:hypothetical protein C8T65DRAFT_745972 [Cerioporus squamosus]|nr:hypothetical protein C8T65DRAFT_745972 [Cerioporus squamosus]